METARGSVAVREPSKVEQASARRVAESKATIPHIYVDAEIRLSDRLEASDLLPLVVSSAAAALREHPTLNGAYRDGRFETYSRVNIGVAIFGNATVVPTVFDADTKGVEEIAAEVRALTASAADGTLTSPQLAGGTFTLISVAEHAVRRLTPVIHAGQAAVLGIGGFGPRAPLHMTLACDHRMVGANEAAAFLAYVRALLEER